MNQVKTSSYLGLSFQIMILNPRWCKVWRDLWIDKTRVLLVVLSIAVGVFAVGTIASLQMIIVNELSAGYAETNPAHAAFYGRFDEQTVESVRRMDGVLDAQGRGFLSAQLSFKEEWRRIQFSTILDYDEIRIKQITSVSGALTPDKGEFLIEQASLEASQAEVGDTVVIELSDGKQRKMRISGVVHDLDTPSYLFEPTIRGYINLETQEWLGGGRHISELNILAAGEPTSRAQIQPIANAVKDKLEKGGHSVNWLWIPTPGKHWADDVVQTMILILGAMGFLSLILSGFLVVNMITALLTQQVRQIGVMKAIGARTSQLVQMYLAFVIILALLSLTIAVPLGAWAAHTLANFIAGLLNFYEFGFRIPPRALALEIGVGLLMPLGAALWPVVTSTHLTVQQALTSYGQGEFGNNLFDRLLQKITFLSRPLLLSLRNTFRRKVRLLLTLSTLVLGSAIFIAVLSVHASFMTTLDESLNYWNYDVRVNLSRPYRIDHITRSALEVPGIVAVESWIGSSTRRIRDDKSESPNIYVVGPPADTQMINPKLLEGRWLLPEDENALVINSVVLEEEPDIKVGSQIKLKINGRKSTWRVVGLVQGVMAGPIAYANYPYFAREIRSVGRASRVQVVTEQHDSEFRLQTAAALRAHFESLGLKVEYSETTSEWRQSMTDQFDIIILFLTIMAILIAIVGALGLTGTMSINVLERSREIGVMRAIGAGNGSILRIFLAEGMLIGLLSWLIGGLFAFPISQLLSDVVGVAFVDAPLSYTFSTSGACLWLVILLILVALSSWWPSWRASRLTVRDVLAYE